MLVGELKLQPEQDYLRFGGQIGQDYGSGGQIEQDSLWFTSHKGLHDPESNA